MMERNITAIYGLVVNDIEETGGLANSDSDRLEVDSVDRYLNCAIESYTQKEFLERKKGKTKRYYTLYEGRPRLTSDQGKGQRIPLPDKYPAFPRDNASRRIGVPKIRPSWNTSVPRSEVHGNDMASPTQSLMGDSPTWNKSETSVANHKAAVNDSHDSNQTQKSDRSSSGIGGKKPLVNGSNLSSSSHRTPNGHDVMDGSDTDVAKSIRSATISPKVSTPYLFRTSMLGVDGKSQSDSIAETLYKKNGSGFDLYHTINSPTKLDLSGISRCSSKPSASHVHLDGSKKRLLSDGELSLSNFSFSSGSEENSTDAEISDGHMRRSFGKIAENTVKQSTGTRGKKLMPDSNGVVVHSRTDQINLIEEIERSMKALGEGSYTQDLETSSSKNSKSILNRADMILNRILLATSSSSSDRSESIKKSNDAVKLDDAPTDSVDLTRVTTMDFQDTGSRLNSSDRSLDGSPGKEATNFNKLFNVRFQSTPKHQHRYDHDYDDHHSSASSDMGPSQQEQVAIDFYFNSITKKTFDAWTTGYKRNSDTVEEVLQTTNSRRLAKAWIKWTTVLQRKRKQRTRAVFAQWKQTHLQMKREILMTGSTRRNEAKQEYYKWKFNFEMEQNDGVASFHHKLSLLTKSFQVWGVYIAERRVKRRMHDLARIRFEVQSTRKLFFHWRSCTGKSCFVKRQMNKELLLNVFNSWRKWTQYSKMLHKRHLSACKEYHGRTLMRVTFGDWRHRLRIRTAEKHHIQTMERRSFVLWRLQSRRAFLREQIATNHCNGVLMEKCFAPWMESSKDRLRKRKMFIDLVLKMQLKLMFQKWKIFTEKSAGLRICKSSLLALRSSSVLKEAFSKWKHSHEIIKFKERLSEDKLRRNVRNAAMRWKNKIVKKHLSQKLMAASPYFEFLRLKALFRQWFREKLRADRDRQRAKVISGILGKCCKARVFTAWRLVTQEDHVIHHMVARRQRRDLAKVFDAWRLVVTRNLVSVKYRKVKEVEEKQKIFITWRDQYLIIIKERQLIQSVQKNLLLRVISRWKNFVAEVKHHRTDLSRRYFSRWQSSSDQKVERRIRLQAIEASRSIKLKVGFRKWILKADAYKKVREVNETEADAFCAYNSKEAGLSRWQRQFHVHCIVSEYVEEKKFQCLDNAFRQWKVFVRHQIQDAIGRFTDRLERDSPRSVRNHTLSESYSSVDLPILRSSSGYFGSLPNVAKIGSPLPVSPLATARSAYGRDSPASLSPEHLFDHNNSSPLSGLRRSNTFSSPSDRGRTSSLDRSRSFRERSKSPNSIPSSGSLPGKSKSPVMVPPLFSNSFKDQGDDDSDEVYTELVRPSSLPHLNNNDSFNRSTFFQQRTKSVDDDSPASVFGQNVDEDAMSYYSFQSESAGVNREHFMSGTIRHWRHLPLSRTFRAWFKYTHERKIRRELLLHFVSSKDTWTVKRVFLLWHRKLYCRLAVEKFYRTKMLQRHFKAVITFAMQRKLTKEQNLVAKLHLRNMRMDSVFRLWKRKYTTKRRLQSLVGRWQEAVHISDDDKSKSDEFLKKRKRGMLREAFQAWKRAMQNVAVAEELSTKLLVLRVLRSWKRGATKSKELDRASKKVVLRRTSKVLSQWLQSFHAIKKAEEHYQNTQAQRFRVIFYTWLEWANEEKSLLKQVSQFQRKRNFKLIAQAFFIWSEEAERCKIADDHYRESLLIKVVEIWHEYTEQQLDLIVRLQDYQQSSIRTKTRNVFDWWKRSAICSRVFKERQSVQKRERQNEAFLQWRKNVRQRKAERHYSAFVTRAAFHKWLQKCVNINKQRRTVVIVAKKWRLQTRVHRALEEKAIIFSQEKEKEVLRSSFMQWMESAKRLRIARSHYEQRLAENAMNYWFKKTRGAKELREAQIVVEELVANNLVAGAFERWISYFKRVQKNDMVLENYLDLKQQEILKLCLVNFRINALKGRAEKHCRLLRQRQALSLWTNAAYRCKKMAGIRKRLLTITVRKFAIIWRERTKALVVLADIADTQRKKRNGKELKKRFQTWMLKTRGRTLAKMCFQGNLLKSNFIRWRRRTQRKMNLRKTLETYQEKQRQKQLEDLFEKWKESMKQSQKEKKKAEVHEQIARAHFRRSLMEKCFYSWRNECLVDRMLRKSELKLCAHFFAIWKDQSLGTNKAEHAYDQMLIERSWMHWRRVKIRNNVIRAMEIHERRQQLSQVFSAWYNHTYIRRQAIKDFKLFQKRKIFRKWMQVYNKS